MDDGTHALVIGEDTFPFHRFEEKRSAFKAILSDVATTVTTTDRGEFAALPRNEYVVVVDYLTDSTLTDAQLNGLLEFVEAGGGYVPIHCGADLTTTADGSREEPFPALRELVGGHFIDHPNPSEFGVVVDVDHPVTEGVSEFRIFDEAYELDWDDEEVAVLAHLNHPELDDYPALWVKSYGDGAVCYCSLGHTLEAFENESFRTLLRNAVRWASADGHS